MKIFVSLLFSIAFLSCNLFSDSQKVYDIASKNVVKITSFDEVKNEIRNGYGVSIGKSKCTDTETRDSLLINGFDNSNKGGTDILTTFQTISFASTIFIENKNGEKTEAAVVYIDSQKNIAVIRTKNNLLDTSVNISNKLSVGAKRLNPLVLSLTHPACFGARNIPLSRSTGWVARMGKPSEH